MQRQLGDWRLATREKKMKWDKEEKREREKGPQIPSQEDELR